MANVNNPRGLEIHGPLLRCTMYKIAAAYATALYIGDPVARNSSGDIVIATAGAGNYILGSALGFFTTEFAPLATNYYVASTAGVHYCLVADHPEQTFVMQEDSVGGSMALTDLAENVDLVAGSGGSTVTGMSSWMLDSSTTGTGATVQARLISQARITGNTVGDSYCRWVIRIAYHQGAVNAVGVGV